MILEAATVILSLVVIEGLLSVDNALGIAALAGRLPESERRTALRIGFIGAYGFRVVALLLANLIIQNDWIKFAGAVYLIYLMCSELTSEKHFAGAADAGDGGAKFWPSVWKIGLMDLSLSVDNVVTAVAFSDKLWLVCTGVLIGIIALRLLAGVCLRLLAKYPILEKTAFLLVGYVGVLLVAELVWHIDIPTWGKFIGIVVLTALSLVYSRHHFVRQALKPILFVSRPVMKLFAWIVEAPFRFTILPVVPLFRRRAAPPA
jgi:YkoY family integral membrane protein